MARIRHLRNAPITEGVIDIQARLSPEADLSVLAKLDEALAPRYQNKGQIVHQQVQVKVDLGGGTEATTHSVSRGLGFRYHSPDDKSVAQFRLNGVTVSRLAPYQTWEDLFDEARRLWSVYVELVAPEIVTRVATRFINNLRLPMKDGDPFEAYLTASPQVPRPLPQALMAFLQRVVVYDAELSASANITQYWQPGPASERVPVILDIDVYRESQFSATGNDMWEYLTLLRTFKNRIFFESLTDQGVELYE